MEKMTFEDMKTFSENSFVRKQIWQTDKLHCNMYCFERGQQIACIVIPSLMNLMP